MKSLNFAVLILSILIFLTLVPLSFFYGTTGFIPELFIFITLSIFFYWTFEIWNLNLPIYALLNLGFIAHSLGVLGFYGSSPLPIQWDHISHFIPMFAFSLLFFRFLSSLMDSGFTKKNFILIVSVFLLTSGIGAVIELSEFLGYLKLGFGEGAFRFGAGDGTDGIINELGGGWINTGWDLIFNSFGAIAGLVLMLILRAVRKKPKNAYYFEPLGEWSRRIS